MAHSGSFAKNTIAKLMHGLARLFIALKKPTVVCVAGSVGKTSTKLMLYHLLGVDRRVSCMDDSYNNGLGLYLSVFELKVPQKNGSAIAWAKILLKASSKFFLAGPDILILEYGIDNPGDMDEMISFIQPNIAILTAVTPEHMEFLHTIDIVAQEETKILRAATEVAVANAADIDAAYLKEIDTMRYGTEDSQARYTVREWTKDGAIVDFEIEDWSIHNQHVQFISEALIRQLSGAALVAKKLGISKDSIQASLGTAEPAASRMHLFAGVKDSTIIDDTTNFSPDAGIEALQSLKRIPASKHIAVLGNMHELGAYADKGYAQVAKHFGGLDRLILVGDLSCSIFGKLASETGFQKDINLHFFNTSIEAGVFIRDTLDIRNAAILVKGPFGGYFLEEAVKRLLENPADISKITRQSPFWIEKKRKHFGDLYEA